MCLVLWMQILAVVNFSHLWMFEREARIIFRRSDYFHNYQFNRVCSFHFVFYMHNVNSKRA